MHSLNLCREVVRKAALGMGPVASSANLVALGPGPIPSEGQRGLWLGLHFRGGPVAGFLLSWGTAGAGLCHRPRSWRDGSLASGRNMFGFRAGTPGGL